MTKVNKAWHKENRMPKTATTQQRLKWHLAHADVCACRPMPTKLQKLMSEKTPQK
jgi:hypothetical protein